MRERKKEDVCKEGKWQMYCMKRKEEVGSMYRYVGRKGRIYIL
jgi:hypothetical protein